MEFPKNRIQTIWVLLLAGVLFLLAFYPRYLFEPRNHLFSDSGDGLKGYYTYAFHIKNDDSAFQTMAFNYPFGENFIFTDGHPFPSIVFQKFRWILEKLKLMDSGIGALNFLMITSFLIGLIVLYRLLKHFGATEFHAAVFAFGIMVLAPQIDRHTGHLSLIYSFIFPLAWYLIAKYSENQSGSGWRQTILIISYVFLITFIHVYYILIVTAFAASFYLFWIISRKFKLTFKVYFQIFLQVFLPIALFQLFMVITDHHTSRTDNPYGLQIYTSHPVSVFMPAQLPFSFYASKVFNPDSYSYEGKAYIGLTTLVVLAVCLVAGLFNLFSKNKVTAGISQTVRISLIASLPVLVFSFGWTFTDNLDLRTMISKLAQFRSLGRFAWVFYFVSTVFAAVVLSRYFQKLESKGKSHKVALLLLLTSGLMVSEGIIKHIYASQYISGRSNLFKKKSIFSHKPELIINSPERFQAILPLPFYHYGSEAYTRNGTEKSKYWSMLAAYHNNLPLIASALARTSRTEAYSIGQIFTGQYYYKSVQHDFPDKRDFLIVYSKEELPSDEFNLLSKSTLIADLGEVALYSLKFDSVFTDRISEKLSQYTEIKDSLMKSGSLFSTDPSAVIFYNGFNGNQNASRKLLGAGAAAFINNRYNRLMELRQYGLQKGQSYTASFWYYTDDENVSNNMIVALEKDSEESNEDWIYSGNVRSYGAGFNGWTYCEFEFVTKRDNPFFSIFLKGEETSEKEIYADEFLLRKTGSEVWSGAPYMGIERVWLNLFPLITKNELSNQQQGRN